MPPSLHYHRRRPTPSLSVVPPIPALSPPRRDPFRFTLSSSRLFTSASLLLATAALCASAPVHADSPAPEAAKPEASKTETAKTESPAPEVLNPDASKPAPIKAEAEKTESPAPEPAKIEAPAPKAPAPETPKPDAVNPEPTKPEPSKAEAVKPEPAKPEAVKPEPAKAAAPSGKPGFDLLIGNGGALFTLSHGGIQQRSLSVRAGGRPLRLGEDYFLNPVSGTITLAQPLEAGASLSIRYRYDPDSDGSKKPLGFSYAPGFTGGQKLSIVYAATPGGMNLSGSNGSQVTGLRLDAQKVGSGKLSGMMFKSSSGTDPLSALRKPREGRAALLSQLVGSDGKKDGGSGDLQQYALEDLKVGSAIFNMSFRKVGKEFDFAPLVGQFQDGAAKALFDRLQKEKGLTTLGFNGKADLGGGSNTHLMFTQIKDEKDSASQHALGYTSKMVDVSFSRIKVGANFSRLKEADLQNVRDLKAGQERTDFAAALRPSDRFNLKAAVSRMKSEKGEDRTVRNTSLEFLPGKDTKFYYAKQQALSRLSKEADETKKEIKQSLGLNHKQKGLLLQASQESLRLDDPKTPLRQLNQLFKFELGEKKPTTLFLYEKKLDAKGSTEKTNRRMHFSTRITKLAAIEFTETSLRIFDKEKLRIAFERKLKIETDANNPVRLAMNKHKEQKEDGASKAIEQIMLGAKLSPTAELSVQNTEFEQTNGEQTVSGNNLEFTAKPSPSVTLTGNFLNREATDKGDMDEMNLSLAAKPGSVEVLAEYKTAEVESEGIDRKETALSVAAPVSEDTKLQGKYLNRKNKGKNERSIRSLGLNQGWLGGRLLLEMGKTRYLQGHPFTTYAVGFTSSPDPKKPLKLVALYRKMGATDGSQVSEYQYKVDWKVSPRFSFVAKSFQNESVRDGYYYKITPVRGHGFSFDAQLSSRLKFSAGFDNEKDILKGAIIRTKNLTLKGHFNDHTLIDLVYLSRITPTWKEDTPTHWVRLNLKRDLGDENRLVLVGEAKFWKDSDEKTKDKNYVNARLDYVFAF